MKHAMLGASQRFALGFSILGFCSLLLVFSASPAIGEHDRPQCAFCRRIAFLSGARVEVQRSPNFYLSAPASSW